MASPSSIDPRRLSHHEPVSSSLPPTPLPLPLPLIDDENESRRGRFFKTKQIPTVGTEGRTISHESMKEHVDPKGQVKGSYKVGKGGKGGEGDRIEIYSYMVSKTFSSSPFERVVGIDQVDRGGGYSVKKRFWKICYSSTLRRGLRGKIIYCRT